MPMDLSVVICTHNPRDGYFGRVLAALRAQSLPRSEWELVVIDNCSMEPVAGRFEFSWHPRARMVREDKLGLTPARLCGIREAAGELLVFVDDDNVLDPDYLEVARRVAEERPWLGSWSGQCRPGFDERPPEWTRRYWGNLVIREFDQDVWSNRPRLAETMPCGAGLCVRRAVAQHYLHLNESGKRAIQFDRTGNSLLSGGDNDLAACACGLGQGVGLVSALKLTHLIPPERLTLDYLRRLAYGIHYSSTLLDAEHGIHTPPRDGLRRLADWLRRTRFSGPHKVILEAAQKGTSDAARDLAARSVEPPK